MSEACFSDNVMMSQFSDSKFWPRSSKLVFIVSIFLNWRNFPEKQGYFYHWSELIWRYRICGDFTYSKNWFEVCCRDVFRTLPNIYNGAFPEIVNGFWTLNIFAKRSILNVWQGCEYASAFCIALHIACRE